MSPGANTRQGVPHVHRRSVARQSRRPPFPVQRPPVPVELHPGPAPLHHHHRPGTGAPGHPAGPGDEEHRLQRLRHRSVGHRQDDHHPVAAGRDRPLRPDPGRPVLRPQLPPPRFPALPPPAGRPRQAAGKGDEPAGGILPGARAGDPRERPVQEGAGRADGARPRPRERADPRL